MSDAPERLWRWNFQTTEGSWGKGWGGYARQENRRPIDERESNTGAEYVRADLFAAFDAEIARLTAERGDAIRAKDCFQRMTRAHWEALCAMRNSINEFIPMPNTDSGPLFSPEDGPIYANIAELVIADLTESRAYALALEQELRDRAEKAEAERDAALAGAVKVKPLVWPDFREGGTCGRPHHFQYFVTQDRHGRFWAHFDMSQHDNLDDAKRHCDRHYQRAALQPDPDARQADLAKAWMMGREDAAGAAKHAGLAFGYERAVQAIRAMIPPDDLAAKIGGE